MHETSLVIQQVGTEIEVVSKLAPTPDPHWGRGIEVAATLATHPDPHVGTGHRPRPNELLS